MILLASLLFAAAAPAAPTQVSVAVFPLESKHGVPRAPRTC